MTSAIRDRYIAVAAALFAEHGYAATSVADIQSALGLAPGSGALYKHFRSKRDLLEAVVEHHLATMQDGHDGFAGIRPADIEGALQWLADTMHESLERDHDALRVLLRDLDAHPELLDRVWDGLRTHVYGVFAEWLAEQAAAGRIRVHDPDATAAVLLASLTFGPIMEALVGRTPVELAPARFRKAWVAHALATLTP